MSSSRCQQELLVGNKGTLFSACQIERSLCSIVIDETKKHGVVFVEPEHNQPRLTRYNTTASTTKISISLGVRSFPSTTPDTALPSPTPNVAHTQAGPDSATTTHHHPSMPVLSVTIFASLYGTVALGLTCYEAFARQPAAINTGMAGSRSRSKAPLNHRRKNKSKQAKWWQFWRKNKKPSSGGERGVLEPPPTRPPRPNQRISVDRHYGTFIDPELDHVFEGFSAEHPAGHVDIQFRNSVQAPVSLPQSFMSLNPGQQLQMGCMKKLKKLKSKLKLKPKSTAPSAPIRKNIKSFSRKYELIRSFEGISQGAVHLVKPRESGKRFIVKQIRSKIDELDGSIKEPKEFEVLDFDLEPHKNILRAVECFTYWDGDIPMANVVFEYCDAGDVFNFVEGVLARHGTVPEAFVLHFISSMIDALAFIHAGDIDYDAENDSTSSIRHRQQATLHRDFKPQNVFLTFDSDTQYGLPRVVLGDFGFARPEAKHKGITGTEGYFAPELERLARKCQRTGRDPQKVKNAHTAAADMYAFGVSVWEVVTGKPYYPGRTDITQGFKNSPVSKHKTILRLLQRCLSDDPARRPAANALHKDSAELKAKLQAWYDQGGRLSADIWPDPFRFERVFRNNHGSSNYSTTAMAPRSTSRRRPQVAVPRRYSELNSFARQMVDEYPTIALFPFQVDNRNLIRPVPQRPPRPATADRPVNLFTGEPAADTDIENCEISSTIVEAADLGSHEPPTAWSSTTTDTDDDGLYGFF